MKQKGNNIRIDNSYRLRKGLIVLTLFFITANTFAQNIFKKSILSKADKIVIEFNVIDQIELITSEVSNEIEVVSENENISSLNINLEENKGVIYISSIDNNIVENEFELDKQCVVQPIYSSYKISIPKNKKVEISFTQGNFYSNNFEGDLTLKVEEGIVKINEFEGSVFIHINIGNVNILGLGNTSFNVRSNLGLVTSSIQGKEITKNKNGVEGIFGENLNQLTIKAILANIQLERITK